MAEESQASPAHFLSDKYLKAANVLERAKGKIESALHSDHPHEKETNGKQDGIDENIPLIDVKAPNVFERAKEEIEALVETIHNKTRGKRYDIDENTPLSDVKAPNVFERAKEEIEALVETIHQKIESQANEKWDESVEAGSKPDKSEVMVANLIEKAKEKIEAITQYNHKETHGRRGDIDETTPLDEVKGPNVFERAKEELEAVVETIHPKKEPIETPAEEKGFWCCIGKWLERVCNPVCRKSKGD